MDVELGSRVAVVTGASSGIGRATAQAFAQAGCRLVLAARSAPALEIAARECSDVGGQAVPFACDVTDADDMVRLAAEAQRHFGRFDVWVNDTGFHRPGRLDEVPLEDFRQVIEVNLMGTAHGCRAALPVFRRQGAGTLINIASVAGTVGRPFATAYVASQWAVRGLSEALRMELLDQPGIHVCTVLPPGIDTPTAQSLEEVAALILDLVRKPRPEAFLGMGRLMEAAHAVAPGAAERLMARTAERRHVRHGDGWRRTALLAAAGAMVTVPLGVYAWRRMRERGASAYV